MYFCQGGGIRFVQRGTATAADAPYIGCVYFAIACHIEYENERLLTEMHERRRRHHQACHEEELERIHVVLGSEVNGHVVVVWTQVLEDNAGIVQGDGKVAGVAAGVHLDRSRETARDRERSLQSCDLFLGVSLKLRTLAFLPLLFKSFDCFCILFIVMYIVFTSNSRFLLK